MESRLKDYELWWEDNVVTGKYRSIEQFKAILCRADSRRVYLDLIQRSQTVLDVGCGLGLDYDFYRENNIEIKYFGIDACCGFIEHNKLSYPGAYFVRGRSGQLPFKDKAFGLVTSRHVLEHLKEPYSTIREMCRVSDRVAIIWFKPPEDEEKISLTDRGFYNNTYSELKLMNSIEQIGFSVMITDILMPGLKKNTLWYLS